MSRTPRHKRIYCRRCKRYTKHARPAGEPLGELVYTCTVYGCKETKAIEGVRKGE